jgi:hypothetical protein
MQLEVDERSGHPDGALGKVDDPGATIDEDQALTDQ